MTNWRRRLFPPSHRDWGEAYEADSESKSGLSRVLAYAWLLAIQRNPVGAVVVATSLATAIAGTYLGWLALVNGRPPVVALFASALILQGSYTLLYMTGRLSPLEPLPTSILFTGQSAALLVAVTGFGTTAFDYIRWLEQALIGPTTARFLVATQAVATLYYFTLGQRSNLSQTRGSANEDRADHASRGGAKARPVGDALLATGLMILGLLTANLLATPQLRAMPWMILIVVAVPYATLSFIMARSRTSPDLPTNVIRSMALVAVPTLAVLFVFWRSLGDLGQAALPGVILVTGGAASGAALLTWMDHRREERRLSGNRSA